MPLSFDIHENEFLEEVFQEGLEKGLQEGVEKGRLESAQQMLLALLESKFGPVPDPARARVLQAAIEQTASLAAPRSCLRFHR